MTRNELLCARVVAVGVGSLGFGGGFGDVGPLFCLAIVMAARAMVDVRTGVEPDHS